MQPTKFSGGARASVGAAPYFILRGALTTAFCLSIWQAAIWLFALPPFILPSPFRVLDVFGRQYPFLLENAMITGFETLAGLAFGVIFGVLAALCLSLFPIARRLLLPLIVITQALPVFAIAPLLALWFGFGVASKVVMAMLIIFFPVTSSFYDGLRRTAPEFLDLGALYQASRWQTLRYIRIPAALPSLTSGLRVGAVFAPIGAIVGEWVGSSAGLGFVMLQSNARMQTDLMFAALILLALMALCLRAAVESLTRRLVPWQAEN